MTKPKLMRRSMLALAAALLATSAAQAFCLPPTNAIGMPQIAASQNAKGCWAGWWCSPTRAYVIAATKQQCGLVVNQRAVAAWIMKPDVQYLPTGINMGTHPALTPVWLPERAKLDALRPAAQPKQ